MFKLDEFQRPKYLTTKNLRDAALNICTVLLLEHHTLVVPKANPQSGSGRYLALKTIDRIIREYTSPHYAVSLAKIFDPL